VAEKDSHLLDSGPATESLRQLGPRRWASVYQGKECEHSHLSPMAATVCARRRRREAVQGQRQL